MFNTPPGPTLLGFDVLWIGSILAGLAAAAVFFAIYTAVTIRDPMQKRVKALNERREQLKAGIVTGSARRRQAARDAAKHYSAGGTRKKRAAVGGHGVESVRERRAHRRLLAKRSFALFLQPPNSFSHRLPVRLPRSLQSWQKKVIRWLSQLEETAL